MIAVSSVAQSVADSDLGPTPDLFAVDFGHDLVFTLFQAAEPVSSAARNHLPGDFATRHTIQHEQHLLRHYFVVITHDVYVAEDRVVSLGDRGGRGQFDSNKDEKKYGEGAEFFAHGESPNN